MRVAQGWGFLSVALPGAVTEVQINLSRTLVIRELDKYLMYASELGDVTTGPYLLFPGSAADAKDMNDAVKQFAAVPADVVRF